MSGSRWCVAAVVTASLAACARTGAAVPAVPAAGDGARPYVVMVSFDAFRHDYIGRYHPPAFARVAARGIRATALVPSFPSKTFPNHYTLVTGLYPGHHGIVGNTFFDPDRDAWYRLGDSLSVRDGSWYGGEPIWATAERNGLRTGVHFWPGSEASIAGSRPTYTRRYDAAMSNARRVDESIGWLRLPAAQRPHLVLLYMSDVDDSTHRHGPDAPATGAAVASVDRALQRLVDSLDALPMRDSVNLVLVSDHGMATVDPRHVMPVLDQLVRGGVDTVGIRISENGPTMSLWFGDDSLRLRRSREILVRTLVDARVYNRAELPARWHLRDSRRAGDLMLVANEGWILQRRGSDKAPSSGVHGYDPALADMHGIFIAAGPGVRRAGVIPAFENIDVQPFLIRLLQLPPVRGVDGREATLAPWLR